MPGSGNETGVKPLARKLSDYHAGVPIKKRRFPAFWPPSSPTEEQSSISSPDEKENSGLSQGPDSAAASVSASSGLSDVNKNMLLEEKGKTCDVTTVNTPQHTFDLPKINFEEPNITSNSDLPKVKAEEPALIIKPSSINVNNAKKLVDTQSSLFSKQVMQESDLQSRAEKLDAICQGKDMSSELKSEDKCKLKDFAASENIDSSIRLKDHLVSDMAGKSVEGCSHREETFEAVSLGLSLSKGEYDIDSQSSVDGDRLPPNRSNWDLNTTMDAWEGTMSDVTAGGKVGGGFSESCPAQSTKPLMCSTGMIDAHIDSENRVIKNEQSINIPVVPPLANRICTSDSTLHLGLGLPLVSAQASFSSLNKDLGKVISTIGLPMPMITMANQAVGKCSIVKQEPIDECIRQDVVESKANHSMSVNFRTIQRDVAEKSNVNAKSSSIRKAEIIVPKLIKSEINETHNQNINLAGGSSAQLDKQTQGTAVRMGKQMQKVTVQSGKQISEVPVQSGKQVMEIPVQQETPFGSEIPVRSDKQADEIPPADLKHMQDTPVQLNKHIPEIPVQLDKHMPEMPLQSDKDMPEIPLLLDQQKPVLYNNLPSITYLGLSEVSTCKTETITRDVILNNSEKPTCSREAICKRDVPQEACHVHVASETVDVSTGNESNKYKVSAMENTEEVVARSRKLRLERKDEPQRNSGVNYERSGSDDEKLNISGDMMEEESYGSDCEFDGNHGLKSDMDTDDDFEDGEVREAEQCAVTNDYSCKEREVEHNSVNPDEQGNGFARNAGNDFSILSHAEERRNKQGDLVKDDCKAEKGVIFDEKINFSVRDSCLQIADEALKNGFCEKQLNDFSLQRKSPEKCGELDNSNAIEREQSSDQVNNVSCGADQDILPRGDGSLKIVPQKNYIALPKVDAALNNNDVRKEGVPGVCRSRIIHLPRSSNPSSPGKTRPLSGRPLQSPKRERSAGMTIEGDRIRPRGRGEGYMSRGRRQDETFRTSRTNFVQSRGRISSRDWNTERNIVPDHYNGQTDFHVARHKYTSGVGDTEIDYSYKMVSDGSLAETGWGGRKLITDEEPIMHHLSSRRRSPSGREGPGGQSFQMVRRVPRNISPSRCIGEDTSELVGMRHSQKFSRSLPEEDLSPVLARPLAHFDGVADHFVRRNRNFESFRRRGPPRLRSRSPVRSRSPRPWCSPRRRTPDGFRGPPELPYRRSPVYRMERIRSPARPRFPREMVARRHGSPSYMSRSTDLAEEHGHSRSVINNRDAAERVLLRNDRRFDIVDSRERTDCEEYYGEPGHSDRYQELGCSNNSDERRFGERRGPVRSFRPSYRRKYHH